MRGREGHPHAVIVPVRAIGVLVEGLGGDASVDQAGEQSREVVCGVLLAQVPAQKSTFPLETASPALLWQNVRKH